MAYSTARPVVFERHPNEYKHWKLGFDGAVATLAMDVQEDAGLRRDYRLKLNSYDLGVDIELADAIQRIRFEHPEVHAVVIRSAKDRIFCAGANIFMLGASSHGFKVNFCKFTNETRLAMEDASQHSGIKFIAAVNGVCAGGGYVRSTGGGRGIDARSTEPARLGRWPHLQRGDADDRSRQTDSGSHHPCARRGATRYARGNPAGRRQVLAAARVPRAGRRDSSP